MATKNQTAIWQGPMDENTRLSPLRAAEALIAGQSPNVHSPADYQFSYDGVWAADSEGNQSNPYIGDWLNDLVEACGFARDPEYLVNVAYQIGQLIGKKDLS